MNNNVKWNPDPAVPNNMWRCKECRSMGLMTEMDKPPARCPYPHASLIEPYLIVPALIEDIEE